ncbi:hypothetical protein [Terasakiella sp.]|uniref:hypothetical protein n=1 Tax=Terasakiella sp. TaxID=2034861 RepID=UPI003AA82476
MERVTRSSALPELPARPDVEGNPGFFGPGDKTTGTPASVPGYEWFNMVQEELCNVVTQLGGAPLSGDVYDQVANAILVAISQAVPDSIDWVNVLNKPGSYPPAGHGHAVADVAGLQAALDGKSVTGHGHAVADVAGLQSLLNAIRQPRLLLVLSEGITQISQYNVGGIVYHGPGDYTVNMMGGAVSSENFILLGMTGEVGSSDGGIVCLKDSNSIGGEIGSGAADPTVNSFRVQCLHASTGSRADASRLFLAIFEV